MHQLMNLALRLLLFLSASLVRAQSIDLGRDEIPVTLPAGYSQEVPTPLIVLLHGYTSSGARVDANMGLSAIADDYGFLLVAPNGTREATDRENSFWNASLACCNFTSPMSMTATTFCQSSQRCNPGITWIPNGSSWLDIPMAAS